jgi:ribosomal protein S19E (S16A)
MNAEIDYDLTPDQWEALKALRGTASDRCGLNRSVVDHLVALGLAIKTDDRPVITRKGRSVLLRGSPRLWDVAA